MERLSILRTTVSESMEGSSRVTVKPVVMAKTCAGFSWDMRSIRSMVSSTRQVSAPLRSITSPAITTESNSNL